MIEALEKVERGEIRKLMFFLPPGAAKSTYSSKLFPAWYLARKPGREILSCSHSLNKAEEFGRWGRNCVKEHHNELGYSLKADSQAAAQWGTSNKGSYMAVGVGAGISGFRADLALIDDPIGTQEDADSKTIRDKQWEWYCSDLLTRLKPHGSVVLIMTRRHEDDLAGRLLAQEANEWTIVSLPFIAEENDPLGRQPGDLLWPEWFTQDMLRDARKNPQTFSSLYQQRPTPEEGDFFKAEWFVPYNLSELPADLRIYCASDHAVSLSQNADKTCLIAGGVDENDTLWILPDLWWERAQSDKTVTAMLEMAKRRKPIVWWAEKGHISKSIGPFLQKRMIEERCYIRVDEVTPSKDKQTRAQSIQGRMSMGKVRFPTFAPWWSTARHEMLCFPHGKHDDFVDALAHLGGGLARMTGVSRPAPEPVRSNGGVERLTWKWMKDSARRVKREREFATMDN